MNHRNTIGLVVLMTVLACATFSFGKGWQALLIVWVALIMNCCGLVMGLKLFRNRWSWPSALCFLASAVSNVLILTRLLPRAWIQTWDPSNVDVFPMLVFCTVVSIVSALVYFVISERSNGPKDSRSDEPVFVPSVD